MKINPVEYLFWAKNRPKVPYDLSQSGAPPADLADYGAEHLPVLTREIGVYGHHELIDLIANAYSVSQDQVLPTPGTSCANFIALAAAVDRGDIVALEWPCYEPLLRVCEFHDLKIRHVDRGPQELDRLEQAAKDGARAIVLSNLHNPTGQFLDRSGISRLAETCSRHDCRLIVDEAYLDMRHVLFGEPRWTAASLSPHVLTTNSLTKVYGLGPLRVGWLIASGEVMAAARRLTDHMHVVNSAPSAGLGIAAWNHIDQLAARTRNTYETCWPVMAKWLSDHPEIKTWPNQGALFQYLQFPGITDTSRMAQSLLNDHEVLVTEGRFFGQPDCVRIGFGLGAEQLAEALTRVDLVLAGAATR